MCSNVKGRKKNFRITLCVSPVFTQVTQLRRKHPEAGRISARAKETSSKEGGGGVTFFGIGNREKFSKRQAKFGPCGGPTV